MLISRVEIVIPAPLRRALGLVNGGKVVLRLSGSRVIMEVINEDLEKRVSDWVNTVLSLSVEPFTEEVEESWKWLSREYVEKKLGLR